MRSLVITFLFIANAAQATEARVAVGMGMENRLQEEVNPDYTGIKSMPTEYVKVLLWPWAMLVELSQEGRDSSSGSLMAQTRSTGVGLWGRYEFREPGLWSPYAGAGFGSYFDVVSLQFEDSHNTSYGRRGFGGLNVGLTSTLWNNLLLEGEGRMTLVEDTTRPVFSALLRIGFAM